MREFESVLRKISFLYVQTEKQNFTHKNRKNPDKIRVFLWLYFFCSPLMVEMAGVEPASESTLTGTSPGADDHLHSLT